MGRFEKSWVREGGAAVFFRICDGGGQCAALTTLRRVLFRQLRVQLFGTA